MDSGAHHTLHPIPSNVHQPPVQRFVNVYLPFTFRLPSERRVGGGLLIHFIGPVHAM
jgi:hypothetical protein